MRRNKACLTNSKSIDEHSNPRDVIKNFDSKYRAVLDKCEAQTNSVPSVSALNTATLTFSVKYVENPFMGLNSA